jgi:hypothetical protein
MAHKAQQVLEHKVHKALVELRALMVLRVQ